MKQRFLTTSMDIRIIDQEGYYASLEDSFWNDWTVKIQWFEEGYNEKNEVLGNITTPLYSLFIFAMCQQCGRFVDDETDLDEFSEEEMICLPCWEREIEEDYKAVYEYDQQRYPL